MVLTKMWHKKVAKEVIMKNRWKIAKVEPVKEVVIVKMSKLTDGDPYE
jgi:hypothetical protein